MPLHLTKIAFGAKSYDHLAGWFDGRGAVGLTTRNRPTRHEECVGGSLFWIINHAIVAHHHGPRVGDGIHLGFV
jgi:hypothetical protein